MSKYRNEEESKIFYVKHSYNYIKQVIKDLGYILISETYNGNKDKLIIKDNHGYYYYTIFTNLIRNHKPDIVNKNNPYSIQNIKLWLKLNNKYFEIISEKYIDAHKDLIFKCSKEECQETFTMNWNHIHRGHNCPYCAGERVGISNCLATKNPELTKEWHPTKNGDLTSYDVTSGSNKNVWWKCRECDHEWKADISNRHGLGRGCPECSKSKGEKECKRVFDLKSISYISQKTFDSLTGLGGGLLSYDFYLQKYNLLIEYQGEQHEKYIKGFHKSVKDFERQVEHDRRKKEYVLLNGYNFLEIWYWDFDNIEEILEEYLKSLEDVMSIAL